MVLDEISRKHHARVGHPGDDVSGGMTRAQLHQFHFALAEKQRHFAFEGMRGPSEAGNAFRIPEQPRKTTVFRFPILLPSLGDEAMGLLRRDDALRIKARRAEDADRVIMRQDNVFDRLVGDSPYLLDDAASHCGRRLRVENRATVVADDYASVGIAFRGKGVEIGPDFRERYLLFGEIAGRSEFLLTRHVLIPLTNRFVFNSWWTFASVRSCGPRSVRAEIRGA